jgi:hypothetical protein
VISLKIKLIVILIFILILIPFSGCAKSNNKVIDVVTFQPLDYDVSLFSDAKSDHNRNLYIDAIIELKAKYPTAFKNVQTGEMTKEEAARLSEIEETTLIISKNGQTVSRLSGDQDKSKIVNTLEKFVEK